MKRAAHVVEALATLLFVPLARVLRLIGWRAERIVIVGWWGSETVGDVAILGQVLAECSDVAPDAPISVVSFDRALTADSLADLVREDAEVIGVGVASAWAMTTGRAMIFGGGPLMESPSMPFWALRARFARWAGTRVMIYACGIGPVRSERTARAIRVLVRSAHQVVLRDQASRDWDRALSDAAHAVVSFDPAYDYVRERRAAASQRKHDQLALALRVPPAAYLGGRGERANGEEVVNIIARALNELLAERPLALVGCVMHTGFPGSDDHDVYARIRQRLKQPERLTVAPGRHTIGQVVRELETSQAALTVRFHGMILALATDTPFVAIDYARPTGKVSAAAALVGRSASVVEWDRLDAIDLARQLRVQLDRTTPEPEVDLARAREVRVRALRAALG